MGSGPLTVEVLHVRDSDTPCCTTVFIDGRQVVWGITGVDVGLTEHNIDLGAGHDLESWDATTRGIEADQSLSPVFRQAVVDVRNAYRDNQIIENEDGQCATDTVAARDLRPGDAILYLDNWVTVKAVHEPGWGVVQVHAPGYLAAITYDHGDPVTIRERRPDNQHIEGER